MAEKKQEKKRRKPLTDKQSYRVKNEYLTEHYSEVTPMAFYRDMFPVGSFERRGHHEDAKANGILTVIDGDKARNYIVFDKAELSALRLADRRQPPRGHARVRALSRLGHRYRRHHEQRRILPLFRRCA